MKESFLILKGCRQNNLKNLSLEIPKNKIIVITGVSGSGKSSLAFDTIFSEGQRRYLEYLSPQARALIKQMPKPELDFVEGLSPTLAIGQGKQRLYPQGTIATYTDIYDFLALLYANIGQQHSPATGKRLIRHTRQEIVDLILKEYPLSSKLQLLAPLKFNEDEFLPLLQRLQQMGFVRLSIDGKEWSFGDALPELTSIKHIEVIVDRIEIKEGIRERLSSSIETILDLSHGILKIQEGKQGEVRYFTEIYVCPESGLAFPPLKPADFNFNSIHGACPRCHGKGLIEEGILCPVCQGARLKPESLACLIDKMNIQQLCSLTVSQFLEKIASWRFEEKEQIIANEIIPAIKNRLLFLEQVGLGYLELNRAGHTLSDGEIQRIHLASQIGVKLSGILYILDEPTLGLHRQDIAHFQKVIQELKALGNTLIIVEHEKSMIKMAEQVIEIGPQAGVKGGYITFQGSYNELLKSNTATANWLNGTISLPKVHKRKIGKEKLELQHVSLHNIKDLSVKIPLNCLVGFCGVSGSGKSTLALEIISQELPNLKGAEGIKRLVTSQHLHEKISPKSIPATYVELMTPLRQLFAETRLAKARGYTASRFSLNKKGGRCEACEGIGQIRVSMRFMPDIFVPCEVCGGLRYNYETLQVHWEGQNMAQVLSMTVEEAYTFFKNIPMLSKTLFLMKELGLDYLTLGQTFNTLSSGEIQRLRLVADLAAKTTVPTLYILDEPSAGLHFQDIVKLVAILHRLVDEGHSVFVIEHHIDILKQTDWLIELGPGGGPQGGKIIFEGPPTKIFQAGTPTGKVFQ